jgi:AcrR family transcriptional regulator
VSASTIFRYFDGLEDMQHQALARFRERFGHLFHIPNDDAATHRERIARFVEARLTLYERVGTIMLVSRLRALDHEPLAIAATEQSERLANQAADYFAPVLDAVSPARRADLVALIDSLTAPEAWDTMRRTHKRSARQIKRAWCDALADLLAAMATPTEESP